MSAASSSACARAPMSTTPSTPMSHLGDRFLIERMVEGSVAELIVGVVRDPQFGPTLTVGAGGVLVEMLQDAADHAAAGDRRRDPREADGPAHGAPAGRLSRQAARRHPRRRQGHPRRRRLRRAPCRQAGRARRQSALRAAGRARRGRRDALVRMVELPDVRPQRCARMRTCVRADAVKLERRGAVLEITLDRPKANAIDLATSKALHAAFRTLQDDPAAARRHSHRRRRPHLLRRLGPQGRRLGRRSARHRFRAGRLCRPHRLLGPVQAGHRGGQRRRHRRRLRAGARRRPDGRRRPCRIRPVRGDGRARCRCRRDPAPAAPRAAGDRQPNCCSPDVASRRRRPRPGASPMPSCRRPS